MAGSPPEIVTQSTRPRATKLSRICPAFVEAFNAMQIVAVEGHGHPNLQLWTPFINLKKSHIATIGSEHDVDYSQTWSCYKGQELHCGACGTCYERREAFRDGGVADPTIYQREPVLA